MIIEAFIDCHPPTATAQHKSVIARDAGFRTTRRGKIIPKHKLTFFEQGDVEKARSQLMAHFRKHAPCCVLAGPLKFTCVWSFYWNKADEAKRKREKLPIWVPKITAPDGDNLAKMVKDVLQKLGYCANDAHISCETYIRGNGDRPGIHFRLEPYERHEWYAPPENQPIQEVVL
jgi:Holliday junction resolvase RusA-like endonuclease